MKLIIQIPCYNEEGTLAATLKDLPDSIPGFDEVETLLVDDGSTDRTVEVAREEGVDHIVQLHSNQGLARAFLFGIESSVRAGADVIVNTDADNQYCAADIVKLTEPILSGQADLVIGERPIQQIAHFSFLKKCLQQLGSLVVRMASNTNVGDAPSGFRAMTRQTAIQLNVFNEYTYTLESIIQAGQKRLRICSVPIRVNEDLRPSRLIHSLAGYLIQSASTIVRIFVLYRPFRFFASIGTFLGLAGFILGLRFLYFFMAYPGETGKVQSVILSGVLLTIGALFFAVAFIADLISVNRRLLEDIQTRVKRLQYDR
jgi:glycosyltransferase involved in cell wall biosynthesis